MIAILVAGLLWYLDRAPQESPAPSDPSLDSAPAAVNEAKLEGNLVAPIATPRDPASKPSTSAKPATACTVTGRVVDPSGAPVAGQPVQLMGSNQGFSLATSVEDQSDDQGRFRIEWTQAPGSPLTLRLLASPATRELMRDLNGQDFPLLVEGTLDVGDWTCDPGFRIAGRVLDTAGAPVASAKIRAVTGRIYLGESDAQGNFALEGIPAGVFEVVALGPAHYASGPQSAHLSESSPASQLEFVLTPSPTIDGRVVDEQGLSVAGATVQVMPQEGGSGRRPRMAMTDDDGHFATTLPQHGLHEIEIFHPDFDPWPEDRPLLWTSDSAPIEAVLVRTERHRFRVVSAADGKPIPHFSLRRLPGAADGQYPLRRADLSIWLQPHRDPEGRIELPATAVQDAIEVAADGFQVTRFVVQPVDKGEQVLALPLGWTLTGRVVQAGMPVPGALGRLAPVSVRPKNVVNPSAGDPSVNPLAGYRSPDYAKGSYRAFVVDQDGRFAVTGMDGERFTLRISQTGQGMVELEVGSDRPDVGDIELQSTGSIAGSVILPPHVRPEEVRIRIAGGPRVALDSEGKFLVQGVALGLQYFTVSSIPNKLKQAAAPRKLPPGLPADAFGVALPAVEVVAGETREVVLDLNSLALTPLRLQVLLDGQPMRGLRPSLGIGHRYQGVDATDDQGWTTAALDSAGCDTLKLQGDWTTPLEIHGFPVGVPIERSVSIPTATLRIRVPDSWAMPTDGSLRLRIGAEDTYPTTLMGWSRGVVLHEGEPDLILSQGTLEYDPYTRWVTCVGLLEGDYEVTLKLEEGVAQRSREGSSYTGGDQLQSATRMLNVRLGQSIDWLIE